MDEQLWWTQCLFLHHFNPRYILRYDLSSAISGFSCTFDNPYHSHNGRGLSQRQLDSSSILQRRKREQRRSHFLEPLWRFRVGNVRWWQRVRKTSILFEVCLTLTLENRFGASLSYASSDGKSGSSSSQTLAQNLIGDDTEIIILSDQPCTKGSCGYTRPGGVAYRAFYLPFSSFRDLAILMGFRRLRWFSQDLPL